MRVPEPGCGAALREGIAGARGPFIIMGDEDERYDIRDVPRFVEKLREGNDIVLGNRFRGEIKPGAMPPLHKYFGNPGLTALLNTLFHAEIGDGYCGMRGFTRSLYDRLDLRSSGMEFAGPAGRKDRSEEHTSELQSHLNLVCRLLLEKKHKP